MATLRVLVSSTVGALLVVSSLFGETTSPAPPPHIEMWLGVRRIDTPPGPAPIPPPAPAPNPPPAPANEVIHADVNTIRRIEPEAPRRPLVLSSYCVPGRLTRAVRDAADEIWSRELTAAQQPATAAEAPQATSPSLAAPAVDQDLLQIAWQHWPLLAIGAIPLLSPALFGCVLLVLFRGGPMLRIEYVSNPSAATAPSTPPPGGAATPLASFPSSTSEDQPVLAETPAERLDMGLSYERKRQLRDEQEQQQEQAILQQFLAENLQLRAALAQSEPL